MAATVRLSKVKVSLATSLASVRLSKIAVKVYGPPVASFTSTTANLVANFNASASTAGSGATITNYAWTFGDTTTGTGVTPTHTYTSTGTYTVTLTVTDSNGAIASSSHPVSVTSPVVATLNFTTGAGNVTSSTTASGTTISANKPSNTTDKDLLVAVITNRDSTATFTSPTGWLPFTPVISTGNSALSAYYKYIPTAAGESAISSYPFTMSSGNRAALTIFRVTGSNSLLVQDASGATVINGTSSITLPGFNTATHGSLILAVMQNNTNTGTPSIFSTPSGYTNISQITSNVTTATTTLNVAGLVTAKKGPSGNQVFPISPTTNNAEGFLLSLTALNPPVNQPPVANFSFSMSNLSVNFNGAASVDPDGVIASYAWTFGDGGTSTIVNPAHNYAAPGTYTATLTVTDQDGATNSISKSVHVTAPSNQPPVASFTSYVTFLNVFFDGTPSVDPDGSIFSYTWDYGDGTTATGAKPVHSYANPGTYTVSLTVLDNLGLSGITQQSIVTSAPPTGAPVRAYFLVQSDGSLIPVIYKGVADGAGNLLPVQFDGVWDGSQIVGPYSSTPLTGPGTYPG